MSESSCCSTSSLTFNVISALDLGHLISFHFLKSIFVHFSLHCLPPMTNQAKMLILAPNVQVSIIFIPIHNSGLVNTQSEKVAWRHVIFSFTDVKYRTNGMCRFQKSHSEDLLLIFVLFCKENLRNLIFKTLKLLYSGVISIERQAVNCDVILTKIYNRQMTNN